MIFQRQIIKERAEALLDKIPDLELALDNASELDATLEAKMNDFSSAFREFRSLEKMIGPPVRETGTEMAVQEVKQRLKQMEKVWQNLAEQALARQNGNGKRKGSVAGKRLPALTLNDWLAPEMLAVFEKANGGRLGHVDLFAPAWGLEDALSVVRERLRDETAAPGSDNAYFGLNLTFASLSEELRPERRHLIVIDKLSILRHYLPAILQDEILPSEYEFILSFSVAGKGTRRRVFLETISTGAQGGPLESYRKKGITSATFKRFVEILACFYPGTIDTCAVSPVTEHWFKKHFNAVLHNADKENYFQGVILPQSANIPKVIECLEN